MNRKRALLLLLAIGTILVVAWLSLARRSSAPPLEILVPHDQGTPTSPLPPDLLPPEPPPPPFGDSEEPAVEPRPKSGLEAQPGGGDAPPTTGGRQTSTGAGA